MNFRTIGQMNDAIVAGLVKVPHDIDLVVGVPRSGMLPAAIVALYLNVALTDVDGLLEGRLLQAGLSRKTQQRINEVKSARKILVMDDSCLSGKQLNVVREQICNAKLKAEIIYCVVYATSDSGQYVDLYFELCPMPRMFEWNIMHHPGLVHACLDIDGVLCSDPSDEENDDGANYCRFLDEAKPLWIPTTQVGWLVTSRLEKYRAQTENWLSRHGVKFGELVMLNMNSAAERRAAKCHGKFKGEVYRLKSAQLFIESDPMQALEISEIAGKTVFCSSNRQVYLNSKKLVTTCWVKKLPSRGLRLCGRTLAAIKRRIQNKN
jgi:uncharacterized HAD superfamily protein/adenine/guanine phosphoribosyltransferase-like PRPP-binding protein